MTKSQLWLLYCAKNPSFAQEGNVTLSAAGLKKLFDQTWDQAIQSVPPKVNNHSNIFGDIFGGKV